MITIHPPNVTEDRGASPEVAATVEESGKSDGAARPLDQSLPGVAATVEESGKSDSENTPAQAAESIEQLAKSEPENTPPPAADNAAPNIIKEQAKDELTSAPGPAAETLKERAVDEQANEHKKRIPQVWIPATLSVGLLIAALYLGGRIVNAHRSTAPAAPAPPKAMAAPSSPNAGTQTRSETSSEKSSGSQPASAAVNAVATEALAPKPPVTAPAAKEPAAAKEEPSEPTPEAIPMITPQAGQRYLQVGALDLEATRRFVEHLRGKKFEPHVAPGPKPELLRVLIGPFDNRDTINEIMSQLQSEGLESFVREY